MTYTLGIPAANLSPAAQQADLATNSDLANTFFGIDHVAYTAAADQGEHVKVTFNNVQADPVIAAPKAQLYTKTVAGNQQLFFANAGGTQQISAGPAGTLIPFAQCRARPAGGNNYTVSNSTNIKSVVRATGSNFIVAVVTLGSGVADTDTARALVTVQAATGGIPVYKPIIANPVWIATNVLRIAFWDKDGEPAEAPIQGFTLLIW